jgi:hypothetical protein
LVVFVKRQARAVLRPDLTMAGLNRLFSMEGGLVLSVASTH